MRGKQQTVVHWLQEALEGTILTQDQTMQVIGLFMQADEMFKEQIIDTFVEGMRCQNFDPNKGRAEIYYNETFKTKQK